jgi:hypothetical protein
MLLHLTREPVAVCWSALKQKKRQHGAVHKKSFLDALRCGWIVLGWSIANLSCELFRKLYPRQYVHLRYEDLARSPVEPCGGAEKSALTIDINYTETRFAIVRSASTK